MVLVEELELQGLEEALGHAVVVRLSGQSSLLTEKRVNRMDQEVQEPVMSEVPTEVGDNQMPVP